MPMSARAQGRRRWVPFTVTRISEGRIGRLAAPPGIHFHAYSDRVSVVMDPTVRTR